MKDLSFFFLKNYVASRMRRRGNFGNSCGGGGGSTSTLNQHQNVMEMGSSSTADHGLSSPTTLEEMIIQLEMEEDIARRAKLRDYYYNSHDNDHLSQLYSQPVRMSCVNSSDILRSARNALNQYPRFSLDGKDAMYRSSFRDSSGADVARKRRVDGTRLPRTVAGERVVWCEPGVVAKLMGLEVIPVPAKGKSGKEKLGTLLKRERLRMRDRTDERRPSSFGLEMNGRDGFRVGTTEEASCSKGGFRGMRSVDDVFGSPRGGGGDGWPTLRFR
ncbi:PREDICTED: uncharacterized protein LOC104813474 [Tarenaya hassleriana]|uniref:uncharacterized protein LOC104813474 n=1 Tax=Tarenaya hassleriana TaxID=28532 RepID=UPI00053C287A|nr:PREDICTED: uncharacterized protein LOC104813474 [Tarenaya hassleriana]